DGCTTDILWCQVLSEGQHELTNLGGFDHSVRIFVIEEHVFDAQPTVDARDQDVRTLTVAVKFGVRVALSWLIAKIYHKPTLRLSGSLKSNIETLPDKALATIGTNQPFGDQIFLLAISIDRCIDRIKVLGQFNQFRPQAHGDIRMFPGGVEQNLFHNGLVELRFGGMSETRGNRFCFGKQALIESEVAASGIE